MSLRASPSDAHAEDLTTYVTSDPGDAELLPLGLDSHRYRCCGNGVVAPVATWLGARLAEALR